MVARSGAKIREGLFGPTAYAAYRTGSRAVHGSFTDFFKDQLDEIEGLFEIALQPHWLRD